MTIYHIINWFFLFSLFGYVLECIVLSCESRKPVFNRGFGHGPFCIIYGFGAAGACVLLQPLSGELFRLYFASMLMATIMELVTAYIMIRLFGCFWWDYSKKPFNYKGIICLESCIGWGFLGIIFFRYLNPAAVTAVTLIPERIQTALAVSLVLFYMADFSYSFWTQLRADDEDNAPVLGRLKIY